MTATTSPVSLLAATVADRVKRRKAIPAAARSRRATEAARAYRAAANPSERLVAALTLVLLADAEWADFQTAQLAAVRARRSEAASTAGAARAAARDYDPREVRAWARANGRDVPARGAYLPADLVAAWRAATT